MAPTAPDDEAGRRRRDEAARRRRTAALAGHTGEIDTARALLADSHAGVRATALGALGRLGVLTGAELDAAAHDVDPTVRRRVAELTAAHPDPNSAPRLFALLADTDDTVVELAAWAAGELPDAPSELVDRLEAVTRGHADALCREAAVAALGSIGDDAAVPTILAALADKATVRRRAVIALAPFEGPEVDAALRRHLEDRDRQVRQAAEDLLGRD